MNKIRILIIDDKPVYAYPTPDAFNHYPVVSDDSDYNTLPELNKCFEVQWLQSPEDTKEYRDFCLEYEDQFGSVSLGQSGYVPEIILFDYALSGEPAKQMLPRALEI